MPTLTVLPESSFTLTVTGDAAEEGSVTLEPTPQAAMSLQVNPLGPDIDLTPLLGPLKSISDALPVDLNPVLDAFAPLATSADLANATAATLDAIAAIPTTDVAAAVALLATTEQLAASEARTRADIAAIPAPDVTATLQSYGTAKKADVTATETSLKTWITSARDFLDGKISAAKDSLAALIAPLAKKTDVDAGTASILSALRPQPGQGARFMRSQIPADHKEVGTETANAPILGAYLSMSSMNSVTTVSTGDIYVSEGKNAGLWRYMAGSPLTGGWQRFDTATNSPVGPRYNGPMSAYAYACPFLVPVGKYIYAGGFNTTASVGSTNFYRFNTETGLNEALASLPRAMQYGDAAALVDGRILFTSSRVTGLTQAANAWTFWLYDPVSNIPPVEVTVDIKITQFSSLLGEGMTALPSGGVLLVDRAQNAGGSRQSVVLHVGANNSITVSDVEEMGVSVTNQMGLAKTSVGVHLFAVTSSTFVRSYVEGQGWGAPMLTLAYPNTAPTSSTNGPVRTVQLPAGGWVVCGLSSGGAAYYGLLCPGIQARGDALVDVYKT